MPKLAETLGQRVRRLRTELKMKQPQVAKLVPGMSASAISQLENDITKELKGKNLVDLAKALQTSPDQLLDGTLVGLAPAFVTYVPIIGFAIANPDEDGFFDDMGFPPDAGMGYLPHDTRDPDAYAVQVKGDSMRPRIRPGEFIVVLPNCAISPEDDVFVKLRNGRKMVKQLIAQRKGEMTFGSINQAYPHRTIAADEIESVHKVDSIKGRGTTIRE